MIGALSKNSYQMLYAVNNTNHVYYLKNIFLIRKSCTIRENKLLWGLPLRPGSCKVLIAKMREENAGPSTGPLKTCPNILHRLRATLADKGSVLQRWYRFLLVMTPGYLMFKIWRRWRRCTTSSFSRKIWGTAQHEELYISTETTRALYRSRRLWRGILSLQAFL